MAKPTRLDYCQYLFSIHFNYTLTYFADHTAQFSHDAINRYLAGDRITPRAVWKNVKSKRVQTQKGFLIFDDTVIDKRTGHTIETARPQYSGNAGGVRNRCSALRLCQSRP